MNGAAEDAGSGDLVKTLGQITRFGAVGVLLNVGLYVAYLGLTNLGLSPIWASTLVFLVGIPLSLFAHGRVTFRVGPVSTVRKLIFAGGYITGYGVQIGTLAVLHYGLGLPHPVAQLIAMLVVAAVLFVYQKTLVFEA